MSIRILTEKLSLKNYCQALQIQSGNSKEINDFCSGPNVQFYSLLGSYDWGGFLLVIWKDDQFTKHLPRYY
jgi:hypothetical protein